MGIACLPAMPQPSSGASAAKIRQALLVFFLATIILATEVALYSIRWILMAVVIGIGVSVLLSPVIALLRSRLKVPQIFSAFLFFVLSVAVVAGISYLIYTLVAEQLVPLLKRLPELANVVRTRIAGWASRYPALQQYFQTIDLSGAVSELTQRVAQGFRVGATAIGGLIFVVFLAIYLAINPRSYLAGLLSLFPSRRRPRVAEILQQSAHVLRQWFGAQLIAMVAVGTLTGLGLLLIGVDYWLLFGALTSVLDIVPYVGPIVAAAAASFVTLSDDPGKVPWVIGLFILMQQIEGHVVIPLVMKERVNLPPAHLVTLMLILGSWFGILGLLIAPGLLAIARTVYRITYLPVVDSLDNVDRTDKEMAKSA